MALYSRLGSDEDNKPLPSLPSPTLTNPDMVLPDDGFPRLLSSPTTPRRAPQYNYLRDKSNEQGTMQTTPTRDDHREKRGLMSRKMLLVRSQTGSANNVSFAQTLVPPEDDNVALASSPLLNDRISVAPGRERRSSNSSLDSEEMAKMPEFLQKYRNVDMTDDEMTETEGISSEAIAYDEQRRAKEEEEQVSALLSKRAEEILANAKKRLNLMEGNLRGARDLVAPLTAANLKRATSLSSPLGSSSYSYTHRRLDSMAYDTDPYNPSRRMLHSQASSPVMRHDYLGHSRGGSDLDYDRPHTSMSRSRFPIRTPNSAANSPDIWTANLRASRSYDSFGMNKLVIPTDHKQARMKHSPDSSLEPVSEDDRINHIETSRRHSFRAPEVVGVIGLGVSHLTPSIAGSSASEDLRDQMASLKGRISNLKERAREDKMRRASANNLRDSSPFNNASHDAPEMWYNQSSSQDSHSPSLPQWPHDAPTGSRNAFAELAARQKSSGSDSSGLAKKTVDLHKRTPSGTAIVEPAYQRFSHHQYKGSAEMPGAFNDPEYSEPEMDEYQSDTFYEDASPDDSPVEEMASSDAEEDDMEESIYNDVEEEDPNFVPHEEREDAFDYEHFFLHSAMGSYNSGQISSDEEVSDTASVSSTATARAPQTQMEEHFDEEEMPQTPGTPDALRLIEARLQNQHGRSMSSESMSTLATFATADEGGTSRSGSRLDWSSPVPEVPRPSTARADVVTPTAPRLPEMDDGSDRADSGVGGISRAAVPTTPQKIINATSAVSAPSSPASAIDVTALAFKALLDPAGRALGDKDKAVVSGLIESLRRVCVRLQEEDQYEGKVLRRRLDDARRVLDEANTASAIHHKSPFTAKERPVIDYSDYSCEENFPTTPYFTSSHIRPRFGALSSKIAFHERSAIIAEQLTRQKTGTDDVSYQEFDMRTMEQLIQQSASWWMLTTVLELSSTLEKIACAHSVGLVAPPSYEESLTDLPPDYTTTDYLATCGDVYSLAEEKPTPLSAPKRTASTDSRIDFTGTDNIRQHANKKKAKQAAKAAQQSKWNDSDDEGKKDDTAEGGDGNGDGGSGAGGDGGGSDPPGGGDKGGKDEDDWWNDGGSSKKNKKNKKKNAWEFLDEDEEKKEDEPPKDEEPPAAEADPIDEWGSFAPVGGKKKKGKKGKLADPEPEELPPPPPPEPEPVVPAETVADDEWGMATTKKKKGKKGKVEPETTPAADNDMKFDSIDLGDDKNSAPKLDLDLGFDSKDSKAAGGFSFSGGGGWGGGWADNAAKTSWGFESVDDKTTKDDKTPVPDTDWGAFGTTTKSKTKDKKKSSGFDFDFESSSNNKDAADLGAPAKEEEDKSKEEDPWGSFMTTGNKKKDKKKGAAAAVAAAAAAAPEPDPVIATADDTPADDPWTGFETKKDKKKKKNAEPEPVVVVPKSEPEPAVEAKDDDLWGASWSAKDKKKGKKGEVVTATTKDDKNTKETGTLEPAADPVDDFLGWGAATKKKDKKTTKSTFEWGAEADPVIDVAPVVPAETTPPKDDWMDSGWDTGKKKKGKKGAAVEEIPPPPPPPVVPESTAEKTTPDWDFGWGSTSKKDKKSKGKTEPDPEPKDEKVLEPETVEEPKDDLWDTWGTGKKTKSKTKEKTKGITELSSETTPDVAVLLPESVQEKTTEDSWDSWTTGKKEKKKSKKGALETTVVEEPPPPPPAADKPALLDFGDTAADDPWGFGTKKKKDDKTAAKKGSLSRSTTVDDVPKVEESKLTKTSSKDGKSSKKDKIDDILDIAEESTPEEPEPEAEIKPSKEKEDKKSSTSKSTSSGWGSSLWGSSSKTSKTSTSEKEKAAKKEKEAEEAKKKADAEADAKKKADEAAFAAAFDDDADGILDVVEDLPPKKSSSKDKIKEKDSKTKSSDKSSKVDSKSSKAKAEEPVIVAPADDEIDGLDDLLNDSNKVDTAKADGWGFWGTSLKSTSRKATPGKEIGADAAASKKSALVEEAKMPESTLDDLKESASSPPKAAAASKSKTKTSSSIQDRIKALQGDPVVESPKAKEKESKDSKKTKDIFAAIAEPIVATAIVDEVVAPKKSSKESKSKSSKSKDKEIDISPPSKASTPIPGDFPIDDFLDDDKMASTTKKSSSSKDKKISSSSKTKAKADTGLDDLLGDVDILTPPPESKDKDKSSAKKERPKVVRDQAGSSWGFWGSTPTPAKKETKPAKGEEEDSPSKDRPSGVSRSKSARKASEKDPLEKESKSSGSDKDAKPASKSRPSTSRGFGSFFGATATPSKSKSSRDEAPKSSRRHSTAVVDSGLMSPPPESSKKVSSKAAEVLGRSKSKRDKSERKVPDPYAIDSDDMVMVDGPIANDAVPGEKNGKKSRRSKRDSAYVGGGDDTIMTDAPRASDEAKGMSDDMNPPSPLKRTDSMAKKAGLMSGILGAFASRPTPDRRNSKAYESEYENRRKRGSQYDDDGSKRLRRDDRKVQRSRRQQEDAEGAPQTDAEEAAAREARRAERRARRNAKPLKKKRVKSDVLNVKRPARPKHRKNAYNKSANSEKKRIAAAKRSVLVELSVRLDEPKKIALLKNRKPRTPSAASDVVSVLKRKQLASLLTDAVRMHQRMTRLAASVARNVAYADLWLKHRQSDLAILVGSPRTWRVGMVTGAMTGGDKTASWVHMLSSDPPPPPPVEGTIVDAPVHYADDNAPEAMDDLTARELRSRRRRDKETDEYEDQRRPRYARGEEEGVPSSGGSSGNRRARRATNSMGYDSMGAKTWDGRPAMPTRADSKRGSWLKKIFERCIFRGVLSLLFGDTLLLLRLRVVGLHRLRS
ncbi:hypothetical protein AMS68_007891 [Peltaster fructicola]|uniref:Uncharacterized protein n=1 Tax=Peltaster fructicola TaxID=286661 RepID=A0A6H0Y5S8_9PEZI|nr:hypothetical protein AMS68_007891 [Peltaster fructicola]